MKGYREATRSFFERDVLAVAPDLLGCVLQRVDPSGAVAMRITEVEAYAGERDPGAHAYRGKTRRNETMFGPPGHIYSYFTYGLHHAINLVTSREGQPYGCLVRAGEVILGEELARKRREGTSQVTPLRQRDLARGPGCVAQAFGVTLSNNGDDLFGGGWGLLLPEIARVEPTSVGPRVGVSGVAGGRSFPWRFWITGDPTVSAYRPGKGVTDGDPTRAGRERSTPSGIQKPGEDSSFTDLRMLRRGD